jgi:predicted Zn-dependent peptidase
LGFVPERSVNRSLEIHLTVLPTGLRVVTARLPGFDTACVGAFINAGSRNEADAENGVAHFVEHMAFKGTSSRTGLDIVSEIETLGASINAYTATGITAYHVTGLGATVPKAIEILGDVLTDSRFDPDELEVERDVVLQEIVRAADTPNSIAFDKYMLTAYRDQSLGRPILGRRSFVETVTASHLRSFMQLFYTSGNTIVVGCGNVRHEPFVARVAGAFAKLSAGPAAASPPARWIGGMANRASPKFLEVISVLGWNSVPKTDRRIHCHRMLASAIGGGMSSPLFQEVREKRGLVYAIGASHDSGADFGEVYLQAGASPDKLCEVIRVSCGVLAEAGRRIGESEFRRARNQALVNTRTVKERPFHLARYLAVNMFERGRIVLPNDDAAEIEAVTREDLIAAAQTIVAGTPTVAFAGPAPDADYLQLIQAELA